MSRKNSFQFLRRFLTEEFSTAIGLAIVLVFFIASGVVAYRNTQLLANDEKLVAHTHEVISSLDQVMLYMKDAETGQRGYLLTSNERYLEPYNNARASIDSVINQIEQLIADNPPQLSRFKAVKGHVDAKFAELAETIELRRGKGFEAALAIVVTDKGKAEMDALRNEINSMDVEEHNLRDKRIQEMENAYRLATISGLVTAGLGVLVSLIIGFLLRRAEKLRRDQEWLQRGQLDLSNAIAGDKALEELGENVLQFFAKYLNAQAGVFFSRNASRFKRVSTYGVTNLSEVPEEFDYGQGLLGQAAKENRMLTLANIPDGYLTIGSSMGHSKPRHLLISPSGSDSYVNAVLEIGFIDPIDDLALQLLHEVSGLIGVAVKSANYRTNLQSLLEETQRQGEELQAQSEELRVSNEELEEQSRALKESQTRLEQQQAELEQTNSQLEEQTQLLELQRDDVSRAKEAVQAKAEELEMASRYKSDFLANMSHELRTPLNSSLILAKLLADNPDENLTAEQVKYAKTIQSSGNDLLALINDILDLSKIEAGHMEIRAEASSINRIVNDLSRIFDPIAKEKNIKFDVKIASGCPEVIETDRQRFEQVLKNLLSNAFKFTEKGKVTLNIGLNKKGELAFAVTDTGIGISQEQQQQIFEAFRQADSTISRKYGGTGLGLSISRELTRLLGGTISLQSEAGKGSTFTIKMPQKYNAQQIKPHSPITYQPAAAAQPAPDSSTTPPLQPVLAPHIDDDRDSLTNNSRVILVVEDDNSFAHILKDLVHQQEFKCLIANTAEDALILARQYLPSAVLLDVGLPDNSGLSVLDRLKRDVRTRHIPVHVVSGSDYSQTALSLGAVGYIFKPVKREELVTALKQLEARIAGGMRRVLIVEDDKVQRDSMQKLLGSQEVETVGVGTAGECLEKLKESTFDCMVLDLSLPDASGYSLLETLSREDNYSFPPVIVYTGRELSNDEEQKLRRYSKSIIIKGAKSPERLLDEVTLFLHQVVAELPDEQQKMLKKASNRDAVLEGRRILVVEDDVRNVYSLTNILEPRGAVVQIARNGREALTALENSKQDNAKTIDLVLMDVMMPEMDGLTATREIRKDADWKKLPIIMLTAKAMKNDQERCLESGANDYMAKPLDVDKLLSLVRVWMPR